MKAIKIYLGVVTVLLLIALGFGVYVWYTVQQFNASLGSDMEQVPQKDEKVAPTSKDIPIPHETAPVEPVVISTETLTPTQQKLLDVAGFSGDSITITPAMITCAESAVGKDRLAQIVNGSTPSATESFKLLGCSNK